MTNTTSARLAGALRHIAAAGLIARHIEVDTPDGTPMRLTLIDAGRGYAPNLKRGTEPNQAEQIGEGADSAESQTKRA
ncbi:MAG TPA: hypothetical protein VGF29_01850 [Hyphomicrobiaceae bacterium]|jgi:hypothetical protein